VKEMRVIWWEDTCRSDGVTETSGPSEDPRGRSVFTRDWCNIYKYNYLLSLRVAGGMEGVSERLCRVS
jgi:hypothetical protein